MKSYRLGVAGLGTVGAGTVRLLQKNADLIAARAGQKIDVVAACVRDPARARGCDMQGMAVVSDPVALAHRDDVDAVVELMGGAEGAAKDLVEAAIAAGKPVVTANKALLAAHGADLSARAEARGVPLLFEAAVAGGIPIIRTLRDALAGNRVTRVQGILNGTCNFILTRMRAEKMDFKAALTEAQDLGYAEADPTADIDGHDAANKLALLAALAFGTKPALAHVEMQGIRDLAAIDLDMAERLGYRIKLLGVAEDTDKGISQRVSPCLVPAGSPMADVEGVLNAVQIEGDAVGPLTLIGRGAGGDATASAVVGDVIELARGTAGGAVFGRPHGSMVDGRALAAAQQASRWYIRLHMLDRTGVLADISTILRDEGVSVATLLQEGRSKTDGVPVILVTHLALDQAVRRAVARIADLPTAAGKACCLRVETA